MYICTRTGTAVEYITLRNRDSKLSMYGPKFEESARLSVSHAVHETITMMQEKFTANSSCMGVSDLTEMQCVEA